MVVRTTAVYYLCRHSATEVQTIETKGLTIKLQSRKYYTTHWGLVVKKSLFFLLHSPQQSPLHPFSTKKNKTLTKFLACKLSPHSLVNCISTSQCYIRDDCCIMCE